MTDATGRDIHEASDNQPLLFERFTVLKTLGYGAGAAVYYVGDARRPGRRFALKILTDQAAFDEHTLERFRREFEVCRGIAHPNLVEAFELIESDEGLAFTMEYVDGENLGQMLARVGGDEAGINAILHQVLGALAELHRRDIVHRDIKLENILIRRDGTLKLCDLGLMKHLGKAGFTRAGVLLGTAQYLPPEYIFKQRYDLRGDIYALGIATFELSLGRRYLAGMSGNEAMQRLMDRKFTLPREDLERIPSSLRKVVEQAADPNPAERFQSALEMLEAVKAGDTEDPPPRRPVLSPPPPSVEPAWISTAARRWRGWKAYLAAAAIAFTAVGIALRLLF